MTRDDIIIIHDGPGGSGRFACVLSCGPKTFDIIDESGGTERHKRGVLNLRPVVLHDFHDDQQYMDSVKKSLRAQAAEAREERRTGARIKRGQLWPSH